MPEVDTWEAKNILTKQCFFDVTAKKKFTSSFLGANFEWGMFMLILKSYTFFMDENCEETTKKVESVILKPQFVFVNNEKQPTGNFCIFCRSHKS